MSDDHLLFDEETIALQKTYLKRLSGYIADIRRLQELLSRDIISIIDLQKLYRLTHNYIGSGATFGFPEISRTAREFHEAINQLIHADSDATNIIAEKNSVIETSQAFIQAWSDAKDIHEAAKGVVEAPKISVKDTRSERFVFLIATPTESTDELAQKLRADGANVVQTTISNYLKERKTAAHVAVLFSALGEKELPALQAVKSDDGTVSLIVVCPQDNFTTRLEALRLGAKAFLAPQDKKTLLAKIAELSKAKSEVTEQPRILIVDEDGMFAQFYCATLNTAGMQPVLTSSAKEAYRLLGEETFHAIIVNASLPECSGEELTALIRQNPRHQATPIIQLMDAKEQPSRDYLIKPFSPNHLLASVQKVLRK
ncbi:MAG: response regulator transcription factor [Alphaproteobacteria bacterium]|nr:response regulator transcription factor [Alphaproteobacteria bacterium]